MIVSSLLQAVPVGYNASDALESVAFINLLCYLSGGHWVFVLCWGIVGVSCCWGGCHHIHNGKLLSHVVTYTDSATYVLRMQHTIYTISTVGVQHLQHL